MKKVFVVFCLLTLASLSGFAQVTYTVPDKIEVKPGEPFAIEVSFTVQPDWYIYSPTGVNSAQGMVETNVIFQPPQNLTRKGRMKYPEPHFRNGHEVYEGEDIKMSQEFETAQDLAPGEYSIKARITYQTCNNTICLPPHTAEAVIKVKVGDSKASGKRKKRHH